MRPLTIGIIGNPNSGKTTLFNQLTGLNQRVGNWAGVTVERQEGQFCTQRYRITLIDLPGTYSLTAPSEQAALDEQIACRYVCSEEAALFINVLDATNLARNLYLTVQLLEMGVPCIVALNRLDSAQQQAISIDIARLSSDLKVPVVPLCSLHGKDLKQLCSAIDRHSFHASRLRVSYPAAVELQIARIVQQLPPQQLPQRALWLALQLLEGDFASGIDYRAAAAIVDDAQKRVQQACGEDVALLIADARYRYIATVYQDVRQHHQIQQTLTRRLDQLVLNRWLGIPLFMFLMYLIFFISINLGGALQPLFDQGSYALFVQGTQWLGNHVGLPYWLTLLLAQGIGGGINTLMPLIPQIGLMFLLLTFLEDSGYMARAAFVMDRLMQALRLPGKSFVPLIVGFGCNVPAIIGTRTLDSERERLLTIMMAPFMACSARLAIFVVFSATFFGRYGVLPVFSLYLLGIFAAVLTGLLLKSTLLRSDTLPFIMELPTYHRPHFRTLGAQMWQRLKGFVLRAGKIIIVVNLLVGGLNSLSITGEAVGSNTQASALSTLGRWLTPLLKPMGIVEENWPATVGLITGAVAKEVVLGTLNTLYMADQMPREPVDMAHFNLLQALKAALQQTWQGLIETFNLDVLANPVKASNSSSSMSNSAMGVMAKKFHTPVAAYSYLIFVLLYIPCASTVGAIGRESGRGWMWFSVLWGLDIAYSLATLCYQSVTFSHHPTQSILIIATVLGINLLMFGILYRVHNHRALQYSTSNNSEQPVKQAGKP